jgi:hypothetical protein
LEAEIENLEWWIASRNQDIDRLDVFVKRKGNHLTVEKGTTLAVLPAL